MKKFFLFSCLIILNFGCSQSTKSNDFNIKQVAQDKQILYMIEGIAGIPIVVYFNDIKISEENTPLNTAIDLNPYVLKNGKYKIRIKIFPVFRSGQTIISPEDIKTCRFSFGSYIRNKKTDDITNYNAGLSLPITIPSKSLPYFEQEWEIEIKDLPYELEGWSKGQDLRKLDQKQLENKAISFHEKLRKILNDGNADEWIKLTNKRSLETSIFYYSDTQDFEKALTNNTEDVTNRCKNNMISLEDYEMKIYADGKLVTLERKTHTKGFNNKSPLDLKGWGALIRKGQKSGAADYRVLLYLPEDSNDFVIIRK
ncbi:hypothetical protein PGH12_15745 [Chryseobacterium wangxinyae]|uniref:hypothetical protein n=1 Tax=Chryseobacterium sp. CY350 TaxID=2997336 RepID=UPI00226FD961|nr:hypothetical protein [Chryseobacterium sp. CY350]MCY0977818.1 hypothetical protein [Chryseobacterium sp. CY350]WBZ94906.1 hypothetical protein PGH12_15745 [Chryseobacterium sp. CY350]